MTDAAPLAATRTADVQVFGPQAQLVERSMLSVRIQPSRTAVRDVLQQLEDEWPALRPSLAASRLAVDHQFVDTETRLTGDEALALIGLVGGG